MHNVSPSARGTGKNFSPLSGGNPLKSHDSDERIQGKPRKSKPPNPRKTQ
jgi:hypothetical protein